MRLVDAQLAEFERNGLPPPMGLFPDREVEGLRAAVPRALELAQANRPH